MKDRDERESFPTRPYYYERQVILLLSPDEYGEILTKQWNKKAKKNNLPECELFDCINGFPDNLLKVNQDENKLESKDDFHSRLRIYIIGHCGAGSDQIGRVEIPEIAAIVASL